MEIRPLNAPRFRASVLPEHYTEVSEALSKISTRKTRRPTIKADKRLYPAYWEGINTADYVGKFWRLNFRAATPDDLTMFYQELSTTPQQWPAEPVLTTLTIEDTASLPAWLTRGVPPAWLK